MIPRWAGRNVWFTFLPFAYIWYTTVVGYSCNMWFIIILSLYGGLYFTPSWRGYNNSGRAHILLFVLYYYHYYYNAIIKTSTPEVETIRFCFFFVVVGVFYHTLSYTLYTQYQPMLLAPLPHAHLLAKLKNLI